MKEVLVIGAGLAGLTCARTLQARGVECLVLDAAEAVGGRVRTDEVEGFRLDRGFQVLLTAYPATREWLNYDALRLGNFAPGARVLTPAGEGRVSDPWRAPGRMWETLRAPIGTLADKLRVGALRLASTRGTLDAIWERAERSAAEELRARGFSPLMLERFLRPWLGGIFLERELTTSNRMLFFVYRMFSEGYAALPAGGMQRIPEQLAAGLKPDTCRLGAKVVAVKSGATSGGHEIVLADGERINARHVVIACDGATAARLVPELAAPAWRSVTCVQWAAPESPLGGEPVLWLNGTGHGRINNLVVPSDVAADYAPKGSALVSTTVIGECIETDAELVARLSVELAGHHGAVVKDWRALAVQRIRCALPVVVPESGAKAKQTVREGLWVCGDHFASASIQGAMASGQSVGEALAAE